MELSRFLRPSILKFDDWFINVSIGGTGGGEDPNIQKDVYFSGKNAYLYASTGSGVTELHIFGNSVQNGTPSIENPVPIISVGENYLQLYSLDINDPSKRGQIIDFGNIKLRSLPNGVCDKIVYKNGQWKHIQRIVSIIIDKNTTIQDQLAASNRVTIQVNYTLITKASANNTNLCSKISNSTSSVPRFHNYPTTIYVVWDSNKPATFEEAKSLIMGAEFCCELAEPVETILGLPKLQTLNGTTYLLTNDQQVKPYLQGYYDVDTTISGKKIEYVQDGMLSWWQPFGLTNADKLTVIPDKLGNSDLTIKNIGYTNESGFNPTYLQLDGIDDYLTNIGNFEPEHIKHMQVTLSNLFKESTTSYWFSIFDKDGTDFQGIADDRHLFGGPSDVTVVSFLNGVKKDDINASYFKEIYDNNSDDIYCLGIQNNVDAVNFTALNIGTIKDSISYISKERFYEAIAYNRALTDEEVQNNFLVSQIRNGINIPDDVDPIDIIAERTYASGKKFPVYNTYRDWDNDNIKSFKILGYTVQEGTPTPEAPIPLLSVGDEGLKLCISDSETGIALQVVDFGDIVLRSLPNGTCDSIEWDGTNWKHIQRIGYVKMSPSDFRSIGATESSNNTYSVIMYNNDTDIISNDFKYTSINAEGKKHYLNNKFVYSGVFDEANSFYIRSYASAIYLTVITNESTEEGFKKLLGDGFEFIGELAEPITTILEGIPAPQMFDEVTYFGTPSALVKPYMMCECKVKKALKYQGNITAWWYFGGNKSNETDQQIIDISGNGNDLTPYNFAWNRESGWNQGGIHSDGIDDYIVANTNILEKGGLITSSNFEYGLGNYPKYVLEGYQRENNILYHPGIRYSNNVIFTLSVAGNTNPESPNGKDYLTTEFTFERGYNITKLTLFTNDGKSQYSTGTMHELVLFENSLTDNQYDNNLNVAKQRNGVDGDINIILEEVQLLDLQGNELTDSQGYYLTVAS